ncbi:MAG: YifB family Mg chelatase-like AAA ATPase [Actinomycetota bacterium]|nr:YifB family Mg chelatase-like AAA ATPase [Actinomycetota bacterium]MDP2288387.1 YifB family Mg chelatase-like AAA ATPase [Actinomycetota bacterium]
MTLAQVWGVAPAGISAILVKVEVDVSQGLPSVGVVGLAQTSVNESRWRVRSAIINSSLVWPNSRITIGLWPADLPKTGTSLDLPIAVGILQATQQVGATESGMTFIGELGLDGGVRPVPGALAAAIAAAREGFTRVVVCPGNARAVMAIPGLEPVIISKLSQLVGVLSGSEQQEPRPMLCADEVSFDDSPDFADVRGHEFARLALEVAAAGGHHMAMVGPPGVGKTMLAQRLPGILPPLSSALSLEVTAIHALAGTLSTDHGLMSRPPFIAPHHSISVGAMLGAVRSGKLVPGAVTLAHGGVLFLDEAPEFARPCLEGLRQPLEQGALSLMRVERGLSAPARFQLVIAANPCPCGMATDRAEACRCTPMAKRRYSERLSGPLLDRVDIRCTVSGPPVSQMRADLAESSAVIAQRVAQARDRALHRFRLHDWRCNAQASGRRLRREFSPRDDGISLLMDAERRGLNPRGSDRVLRLAWTLADLAAADRPGREQVSMALALRNQEQGQ